MIVPYILFLLSLLGMALTWTVPDLFLLAVLSTVASIVILALAARKAGRQPPVSGEKPTRKQLRAREKIAPQWVVIDGSNVMYWRDGTPHLETVQAVLRHLEELGFTPGVMFDANAGYLLEDHFLNDSAFAARLGLRNDQVMVVPKGVQADSYILTAARDMGAVIVTNDRFRDWAEAYPEVAEPGHLIQGAYREGVLWLCLPK